MMDSPARQRRARRLPLWLGVAGLVLFVIIPTFSVLQARWGISAALKSAAEVRLEEHHFDRVLTSLSLSPADFTHVAEAMPITVTYGIPGDVAMCFIPHHRVVIVPRDGRETITMEVCFGCEQFSLSDSSILPTPAAWQPSLRRLFARHAIPIRDSYPPDVGQGP